MKKPTLRVTKWLGDIPWKPDATRVLPIVSKAVVQAIDLTARS